MTAKSDNTLTILGYKVFVINKTDILIGHLSEHLLVMRLFLCNMSKEEIGFTGDKSAFINLLHTHQYIAIAKILSHRYIQVFILFICIATIIAWLNEEFDVRIVLLEQYYLGRCCLLYT